MSESSSYGTQEPKLRNTIKNDLKSGDFLKTLKREFRELKSFYINAEKQKRLGEMNLFKRVIVMFWWILKSMMLKLTPIRRILLLVGIIFLFTVHINVDSGNKRSTVNDGLIGTAIIILVLMLELKDKLLASDELKAGRKVQLALMPEERPEFPGWSVWLYTEPANDVSGDLIDFINISPDRAGLVMADVAGKGLNAALLTTKLQATVRAFAADYFCEKLVSKVNSIFYRDSLRNIFASLLYVELTPDSNHLKYVNAGHMPPLIIKSGNVQELNRGEAAIGLMKDVDYSLNTIELERGDVFIVYSDGVTEAMNEKGEFFGSEKFINLLAKTQSLYPAEIGSLIMSEINKFNGDNGVTDDLSLIILKKM